MFHFDVEIVNNVWIPISLSIDNLTRFIIDFLFTHVLTGSHLNPGRDCVGPWVAIISIFVSFQNKSYDVELSRKKPLLHDPYDLKTNYVGMHLI